LADTKIIAEAWDAAGAYQVGSFGDLRWAEWNGRYRDDVRRFWRGDGGMVGPLATRLAGSSDLYEHAGRAPFCSINFITSHDGFSLNDLVSYRDKHNEPNNEGNRDGDNNNFSDNYGVEGPTKRPIVERLRVRQLKNFFTTLMMSQGVPMFVMGDEARRTQKGNNNAYCQDNPTSWFDWSLVESNKDMVRFVQALVHFRRAQPTVRRKEFLRGEPRPDTKLPDVNWYNALGTAVDWQGGDNTLICLLRKQVDTVDENAKDVLLLINATGSPREFILPAIAKGTKWRLFVDTASDSPKDVYPELDGPAPPKSGKLTLDYRSLMAFVEG
jgi:glycogen operon protein